MVVAMMGPVALAGIRHTALNSFIWRRRRAMAEFGAGYLAIWATFGVAVSTVTSYVPGVPSSSALVAILILAAFWQVSPWKRRCLLACHRSRRLPPSGWQAEIGALHFGLRNALPCVGSCWCLMLVMVLAPAVQILWMVILTVAMFCERLVRRPTRASRALAIALGLTAAGISATILI